MFIGELKQRFYYSLILVVLLGVYITLAPYAIFRPIFALTLAAVASFALWEYYQLSRHKNFAPAQWLGIAGGVLYMIMNYLSIEKLAPNYLSTIVLALTSVVIFVSFFRRVEGALGNTAVSIFGVLYTFVPLSCFLGIIYYFPAGQEAAGQWWLSYLIVVTVMTDVGAFFVGKIFGKNKLAPQLSPGKTIEGLAGGLLAAMAASIIMYLIDDQQMSFIFSIIAGLVLGCVGQIGDLAESLLKRDMGVKDSNKLPGLGGVLDVIDSLLFNAPLTYLIIMFYAERAP